MSLPAPQLPFGREGSHPTNDEHQTPDQHQPKDSTQQKTGIKEITQPAKAKATTDPLEVFVDSLRTPEDPHHFHMICKDGVMRVIRYLPGPPDQPTGIEIYDAKPMSPEMIKSWLDRGLWSQEKEDEFRGIDGRTVPQEQWMYPPAGFIPSFGTKNERDEEMRKYREERAQLEQKVASGEIERDAPLSCIAVQSDYDLRPR